VWRRLKSEAKKEVRTGNLEFELDGLPSQEDEALP
jgi:hypothetical protein